MQRRKFYVYIQTERQRETYCTYRFPTDGVVNIWRYLQNWFCGTVAVVCKTPSVAEGRRVALCSAHYNEAKQKKGGGEREKSAKFPNANVIALFCCLYLYYMYMYVFIQNHVQNTSLLLYIDVARFDAIFNIFLSYSLFLVFLFFFDRDKYATKTSDEYGDELHTPKRKSTCFCGCGWGWGGRHFFPFPRKFTSLALACF